MTVGSKKASTRSALYPSNPALISMGILATNIQGSTRPHKIQNRDRCGPVRWASTEHLAHTHPHSSAPARIPSTPKLRYHPVAW